MDELFTLGNVPDRNGTFALMSCNGDPTSMERTIPVSDGATETGRARYAISSCSGRLN